MGFPHELTGRPWPGYDDGRPRCQCPPGGRLSDGSEYTCEVCEDRREWLDFSALAEAHQRDPDEDDAPPFDDDGECSFCRSSQIERLPQGNFCMGCGSRLYGDANDH